MKPISKERLTKEKKENGKASLAQSERPSCSPCFLTSCQMHLFVALHVN